jgi:hypothetical protein
MKLPLYCIDNSDTGTAIIRINIKDIIASEMLIGSRLKTNFETGSP